MYTCARCNQAKARYEAMGNEAEHWCLCTSCHDLLRPDYAIDNYRKLGSGPPICVFKGKSQTKYMVRHREGLLTKLSFDMPAVLLEIQIGNLIRAVKPPSPWPGCDCDLLPEGEVTSWEVPTKELQGYAVLDGAIIFVTTDRQINLSVEVTPIP